MLSLIWEEPVGTLRHPSAYFSSAAAPEGRPGRQILLGEKGISELPLHSRESEQGRTRSTAR